MLPDAKTPEPIWSPGMYDPQMSYIAGGGDVKGWECPQYWRVDKKLVHHLVYMSCVHAPGFTGSE